MIRNILAIFITVLLLQACGTSQNDKGCGQFKSGNFVYRFSHGGIFSIVRNDSIQIETNPKTGETGKFSIKWTDDCTYELSPLETNVVALDTITRSTKKLILKTEILTWSDTYYIFRVTSSRNINYSRVDTLWLKK